MQFYGNKPKNNITFAEKNKTKNVDLRDASNCKVQNKGLACFFLYQCFRPGHQPTYRNLLFENSEDTLKGQ